MLAHQPSRGALVTKGEDLIYAFIDNYSSTDPIAENEETRQWVQPSTCRKTGQVYAAKRLYQPKRVGPEPVEASILARVQEKKNQRYQPHCIIRYEGYIADEGSLGALLFTELCNGGSLDNLLDNYIDRESSEIVPEDFAWHVFRQMASALAHLAQEGVVHRNVHPAHMLLTWDADMDRLKDAPRVKLAGFGLAAHVRSPDFNIESFDGNSKFQPPEIPCNGYNSDIWALGTTMHDMCLRRLPLCGGRATWVGCALSKPPRRSYIGNSYQYSRPLQTCYASCLRWRQTERPTAAKLVEMITASCPPEFEKAKSLPEWATQSLVMNAQKQPRTVTEVTEVTEVTDVKDINQVKHVEEVEEIADKDKMDLSW